MREDTLAALNEARALFLQECRDWRQGFRGNAVDARRNLALIRQIKRENSLV